MGSANPRKSANTTAEGFQPQSDQVNAVAAGAPAHDLLSKVALVNARTAAAAGGMGVSWWYERVRRGEAPQPAVQMPRCTRWRAVDVADFWRSFAASHGNGEQVVPHEQQARVRA